MRYLLQATLLASKIQVSRLISIITLLLLPLAACALTEDLSTEKNAVSFSGGRMSVYFDSSFSARDKAKLIQWLTLSAEAVSTLYGQFPVSQFSVHVESKPNANEPVPWGEVWKNGEYQVLFQVNPNYSLESFVSDWTAPHEFSHLIHPHPGNGNSWFGEGLASYYQNILRIRQGSYSAEHAWQKLFEGFQRGERQADQNGMTLYEASQRMRTTGSFMHVHWGGVFYFLTVDMRLRMETKNRVKDGKTGQESLDTAWFKFKKCCLSVDKDWPVEKLIRKLDELTQTSIFEEEYRAKVHSRGFPDYHSRLSQLGISTEKNKVQLSNQASPDVNLRNSIGSISIPYKK